MVLWSIALIPAILIVSLGINWIVFRAFKSLMPDSLAAPAVVAAIINLTFWFVIFSLIFGRK